MTIFIKATKLLMLQSLDNSMEEASAKNQGWLGGWRNAELSGEQKTITLKLRRQIEDFIPKDTDAKSLVDLKEMIAEIDAEVESTRKKHKFERGKLNETLTKMNSDLERFYHTITALPFKLSDIENDTNPFHILCAHAAYYFGENIFYPSDDGFVLKVMTSVVGASNVSVREAKEACLLHHLQECNKKLIGVKEGEEFDELRKGLVLTEVEAIQRENADICKKAQPITTIPISLSFMATANVKAPTLKPSRGRLEVCMKHVLDELTAVAPEANMSLT